MIATIPLISGVFTGCFEVFLKSLTSKKYQSTLFLFLFDIIAIILLLPLFLTNLTFPRQIWPWIFYILNLLASLGANLLLITAYKFEDVSNVALITRASLVFSFIAGIIFFNETVKFTQSIGALIIVIGVLIIFLKKEKIKLISYKGLLLALATAFSYAVQAIFAKLALKSFNPYTYIFLIYAGLALILLIVPKKKTDFKKAFFEIKYKIIIAVFFGVLSYITYLISYKSLPLFFVAMIQGASAVLTSVILGISFLKEKTRIANKIGGLILLLLGFYFFYK